MTVPDPDGRSPDAQSATNGNAGAVPRPRGKIRKTLGYALLVLCVLGWVVFLVVPFLGFSGVTTAAALGILAVAAEGAFVIGIALLGKEIVQNFRALLKAALARSRKT